MATRNLTAEQNALKVYGEKMGKMPETSEEWGQLHKIAYPTVNDLPEELKDATTMSYYQSTGAANPQVAGGDINALEGNVNQASARVSELGTGKGALDVFQEAVRKLKGSAQAPLGQSEIFQEAGLTGYGSLAQSLNARTNEFEMSRADIRNATSGMASIYSDIMAAARQQYDTAIDLYKTKASELQRAEEMAMQHEYSLRLMDHKAQVDEAAGNNLTLEERLEFGLPTPELTDINSLSNEIPDYVPEEYFTLLESEARRVNLPVSLLAGLIQQESGWNAFAANDQTENEKSYGLGQINLLAHPEITPEQAQNPEFAIPWVANRLKSMIDKHGLYEGIQGYNTEGAIGGEQLKRYANNILGMIGSNVLTSEQQAAMDIFNGISNMTLNDVPIDKRQKVGSYLNKLKENALARNDIIGAVRASAGGSNMDATSRQSFEKALTVLGQIEELKTAIEGEAIGPIWGTIRSKNPYDVKARQIKAQLSAIVPNLARGVYGEVGVLTDNDIKVYMNTLPNLTSQDELMDALLGITVKTVQRSIENKLKLNAGTGIDVSGLEDIYMNVKQKSDEMLGVAGINNVDETEEEIPFDVWDYINNLDLETGDEIPDVEPVYIDENGDLIQDETEINLTDIVGNVELRLDNNGNIINDNKEPFIDIGGNLIIK